MHRRAPSPLAVGLRIALLALLALLATVATVAAPLAPAASVSAATPAPTPTDALDPPGRPPVTVSDFYPDDADLSDCLGFVERPGCGSEARGGWGQTLVFVSLAAGLAVVFWRVAVGVRKNRRA